MQLRERNFIKKGGQLVYIPPVANIFGDNL